MARIPRRGPVRRPGVNLQAEREAKRQDESVNEISADQPEESSEEQVQTSAPAAEETVSTPQETHVEAEPEKPTEPVHEPIQEETQAHEPVAEEEASSSHHENNQYPFGDEEPPAILEEDYYKETGASPNPEDDSLIDKIASEHATMKAAAEAQKQMVQETVDQVNSFPRNMRRRVLEESLKSLSENDRKALLERISDPNVKADLEQSLQDEPDNNEASASGLEDVIADEKAKREAEEARKKEKEEQEAKAAEEEAKRQSEQKLDEEKQAKPDEVESKQESTDGFTLPPAGGGAEPTPRINRNERPLNRTSGTIGKPNEEQPYNRRSYPQRKLNSQPQQNDDANRQQESSLPPVGGGDYESYGAPNAPMMTYQTRRPGLAAAFTSRTNDRFRSNIARDVVKIGRMIDAHNSETRLLNDVYNELGITSVVRDDSLTTLEKDNKITEIMRQNPGLEKRARDLAEIDDEIVYQNKQTLKDLDIARSRGINVSNSEYNLHDAYNQNIEEPVYSPPKTGLKESMAKLVKSIKKAMESLMKVFKKDEPEIRQSSGPEM